MAIYTKNLESLSAQQLLDCAGPKGGFRFGCTGGSLSDAIQYIILQGGIEPDVYYPYRGNVQSFT